MVAHKLLLTVINTFYWAKMVLFSNREPLFLPNLYHTPSSTQNALRNENFSLSSLDVLAKLNKLFISSTLIRHDLCTFTICLVQNAALCFYIDSAQLIIKAIKMLGWGLFLLSSIYPPVMFWDFIFFVIVAFSQRIVFANKLKWHSTVADVDN